MEITKEEIEAKVIDELYGGGHDTYEEFAESCMDVVYPIIEKLQSENTALKRKVEILNMFVKRALVLYEDWKDIEAMPTDKLKTELLELEAKLTLLKAEQ